MKVAVCVFGYGGVHTDTANWMCRACLKTQEMGAQVKIINVSQDALIERSRNRTIGMFMDHTDYDVLVMLDRDIQTTNDKDILRLANHAMPSGVVGAIYALKKDKSKFVYVADPEHNGPFYIGKPDSPPFPVYRIGTGMLAISREAITQCLEHHKESLLEHKETTDNGYELSWFNLFEAYSAWHEPTKTNQIISEDYVFCDKMREAGVPVMAYPGIVCIHTGDKKYTAKDVIA